MNKQNRKSLCSSSIWLEIEEGKGDRVISLYPKVGDWRRATWNWAQTIWLFFSVLQSLVFSSLHFRRRQWHPTPVLLPGKSHGWRSLEGCSPWGLWGSDTTERLHFHFSLSCIGEGNGNPFQCSCLENPGMGEPGGLLSMGSHRVGHDWSDLAAAAAVYTSSLS